MVDGDLSSYCSRCGWVPHVGGVTPHQPKVVPLHKRTVLFDDPSHKPSSAQVAVIVHRLAARDGAACMYCGRDLDLGALGNPDHPDRPTIDHVLPRSRGGTWHIDNLVIACRACNTMKADGLTVVVHLIRRLRRRNRELEVSLEKAGRKIEHLLREREELESA
jgi:5-methylcytosine-specific restriction endonuclease McrA